MMQTGDRACRGCGASFFHPDQRIHFHSKECAATYAKRKKREYGNEWRAAHPDHRNTRRALMPPPMRSDLLQIWLDNPRPRTRAECPPVGVVCPYVSCRHHLALDVNQLTGRLIINAENLEAMAETCSLRIADAGGIGDNVEVGRRVGVTRSRVQQIVDEACLKIRGHDRKRLGGRLEDLSREPPLAEKGARVRSLGEMSAVGGLRDKSMLNQIRRRFRELGWDKTEQALGLGGLKK